eukprot:CAMPEP_0168350058 /NCGR_PEP_ID=MMETSP0213-20121227/20862_1 /TAXON_ID=151035 /ORGANISM="Euplotes harpa, Strain FSP1.4" /LENGTH=184 /DNA_ID=CAMNT_0008360271 /DNA_START=734 /DNA_END=1288 /DNA_ORIENTATION=+
MPVSDFDAPLFNEGPTDTANKNSTNEEEEKCEKQPIKVELNPDLKHKEYAGLYNCDNIEDYYDSVKKKIETVSEDKDMLNKDANLLGIRRSCFRALSSYYKNSFAKFNKAWQSLKRNKKKTKDMNKLIEVYMKQEFESFISQKPDEFVQLLKNALIAILHSHRYKKQEDFTKDVDFSVIRDVLR